MLKIISGQIRVGKPAQGVHLRLLTVPDPSPRATVVLYADPRQVESTAVPKAVPDFPVNEFY